VHQLAATAGDREADLARQLLAGRYRSALGRKTQVIYKGHPLYLFSGDTKAGDTNGEGVNAFGGMWYAVSPAGNQVAGSSSGSGGGYSSGY
jgi:hypothetical protein